MNPNQVSGKDSPRIALARFQAEAEKLSAEQCAKEFSRSEYDVAFNMTPEPNSGSVDCYIVSKEWTLKGLRHELAERRFMDSITCNVDQDRWEEDDNQIPFDQWIENWLEGLSKQERDEIKGPFIKFISGANRASSETGEKLSQEVDNG